MKAVSCQGSLHFCMVPLILLFMTGYGYVRCDTNLLIVAIVP